MGLNATVETVMRSPPITAFPTDSAAAIADQMVANNIGAVIVMTSGIPSGIVTERDIVEKVVKARKDPSKVRAQDIMSSPLISIDCDKSIEEALRMMKDKKVRRLAVTRKRIMVVGILTERRLLDSLI